MRDSIARNPVWERAKLRVKSYKCREENINVCIYQNGIWKCLIINNHTHSHSEAGDVCYGDIEALLFLT